MLRKLHFIFLFLPFLLGGQTYPAKPSNYVTDETGTLTQEQQNTLNAKLKVFEDTTTNQIFVYMTASLNGEDLAQYSQDIFHNWKIGQKDKNNGVLISVFKDDRKFRIQTGYGLEGQLPDLLTKRIQDNDMRTLFKQGDYFGGINAGVDKLAYYSCHEFNPDLVKETTPASSAEFDYGKGLSGLLIGYGINALMLFFYIRQLRKKNKDRPTRKAIFMTIAFLLALLPCFGAIILFLMLMFILDTKGFSSSGSYSYSDSSSWSSSDYSSSSSDFGGGGGGDSGGGGSSSDW